MCALIYIQITENSTNLKIAMKKVNFKRSKMKY